MVCFFYSSLSLSLSFSPSYLHSLSRLPRTNTEKSPSSQTKPNLSHTPISPRATGRPTTTTVWWRRRWYNEEEREGECRRERETEDEDGAGVGGRQRWSQEGSVMLMVSPTTMMMFWFGFSVLRSFDLGVLFADEDDGWLVGFGGDGCRRRWCVGGGGCRRWRWCRRWRFWQRRWCQLVGEEEKMFEEVCRLGFMSTWGRGGEDVFGEKLFKKTNKLQDLKVCADARDADISTQKSF
ncbi:hypothetical protein Hanom_Chr09g00808131 [Helianthus anomalus]